METSLNLTVGKYPPENALYLAVRDDDISEVQRLLAESADANFCAEHVNSALCLAVPMGKIDIVKVLLEYGANPNQRYDFSQRPRLLYVVCENNFELFKLLLDHGANISDVKTHIAILNSKLDVLNLLLEKGADPNYGRTFLNSLLHVSLVCSSSDIIMAIVKALIDAGADVTAPILFGQTALHLATCPDIAMYLLENGAQINARDKQGRTPLLLSVFSIQEIYQKKNVVEALLFAGANVDIPDNNGQTFIKMYNDKKLLCSFIDVTMEKFTMLKIKSDITEHFKPTITKTDVLTAELENIKKTKVEGICLYNVLERSLEDFVFFNDSTFRKIIQGDDLKKMFPHFYLLIRLFFRQAERRYFLEELSKMFTYKLSEVLQLNVPTDVGYLIMGYLIDQRDINNLKLALQ